jgi:hypothetical protein
MIDRALEELPNLTCILVDSHRIKLRVRCYTVCWSMVLSFCDVQQTPKIQAE